MSARRVVLLLAPVVIAVVLGPLVAGVAIGIFAAALEMFVTGSLSLADHADLLLFYSIMAYFIGWPVALLTGLLIALWMIRRSPSALIVNAAAVIATVVFMGVAATGVLGPIEETNGRSNLLFTLAAAVVAANLCWLMMRRFALGAVHGAK